MSEYVNFKGGVVSKSNFLPMRKEKFGFGPTGTSRLDVLEGCQECKESFDCANSEERPEGNVLSTCSSGCCVYTYPIDAPSKDRAFRFAGRGGQSRTLDGGRCSVSCPSGGICRFPCDRPVSVERCCESHAERTAVTGRGYLRNFSGTHWQQDTPVGTSWQQKGVFNNFSAKTKSCLPTDSHVF